jgi:molybdopterin-guanine dinucleotide biosynthesis protein A
VFDAIVLAGGRATRLSGADKPAVEIGGVSLLDRTVDALAEAHRVVVVGPERHTRKSVTWCREHPPGAGPVAAIAAGLAHVDLDTVVVLAVDLPWIAPAIPRLVAALDDAAAAVLVDPGGRRNYLAAAWRRSALASAVDAIDDINGAPARALFSSEEIVEIADSAGWGRDCDTWTDVDEARRTHAERNAP